MQEILEYLRSLSPPARDAFAERCHTSVGYLRKAVSTKQQLRVELCIDLDRESGGVLKCERLFPGLDWDYLRQVAQRGGGVGDRLMSAQQGPAAIKTEAEEVA